MEHTEIAALTEGENFRKLPEDGEKSAKDNQDEHVCNDIISFI